jgi:hypothetical protein
MPGHDDHDLERRLREQRPVARDEFVQGLAAKTRSRSHPTARPRLTLAFALSLALLVSLVAFGGVGAAKNAVSSSASSVRSAWGGDGHKRHKGDNDGNGSPAHHQYHGKVQICYPKVKYAVTYHYVTVTKTVYKWKWQWVKRRHHHHWVKVKVPVVITYQKKVRERVKTIVYREKTVQQSKVPFLVSRGAVYPVPAGGCSTLDHPDTTTT